MEARNRNLSDWLTRIRTRQITLPRFQRYEAWSYSQVENLLNTVLQGLPAGAVLTLEIGTTEPFISRPIVTAPSTGEKIVEHLLDGQQRLTALWRSLNATYEDRSYFIQIDYDEDTGTQEYAVSAGRYEKNGQKYPLWADNSVELWKRKLIPVNLLRPDHDSEMAMKEWVKAAAANDLDQLLYLNDVCNKLRNKFAVFNIPFLSLPSTTKPEVALNVFIQMNTSASPLSAYDIVVAQIEAATNKSLHGFIEELKREVPNIIRYTSPEDTVMAVSALLNEKVPSKGTYLSGEFASSFESNWQLIKQGIKKAVSFLVDEKIFDSKRLPSDVVVYVIAALWAIAPDGLDREGEIRRTVRKYIWRAFFTDRYDRTTNSRAFSDFKGLKSIIESGVGSPEIFDESSYPIPKKDDLLSAGWPSRKDRLARAILSVSLKAGGFDFADGSLASFDSIQSREYHHIFPRAWLEAAGRKDFEINRAVNCALISWKTNRNISAKTPSDYVDERLEKSSLGVDEVARRLQSHLIPVDELRCNDYDAFLMARADSIYSIAERLCNGEIIEGKL